MGGTVLRILSFSLRAIGLLYTFQTFLNQWMSVRQSEDKMSCKHQVYLSMVDHRKVGPPFMSALPAVPNTAACKL